MGGALFPAEGAEPKKDNGSLLRASSWKFWYLPLACRSLLTPNPNPPIHLTWKLLGGAVPRRKGGASQDSSYRGFSSFWIFWYLTCPCTSFPKSSPPPPFTYNGDLLLGGPVPGRRGGA